MGLDMNRKHWEPGVWDTEQDEYQWKDGDTGYQCRIVRTEVGALCGYVAVDPTHPYFKKDYDEPGLKYLEVHGGVTFADNQPGFPTDMWWIGFDCAHYKDYFPAMPTPMRHFSVYRTAAYVREQCQHLALQLKELEYN